MKFVTKSVVVSAGGTHSKERIDGLPTLWLETRRNDMNYDHKDILAFLKKCDLMVISTSDGVNPELESALIAFAENDRLEIFFQTNRYTRKAQNLKHNSHVAFVFGLTVQHKGTVQYQGTAGQIMNEEEIERCKQMFYARKSPTAEPKYLNHPDAIYFKAFPRWIGFLDESPPKTRVIECKEFGNVA